MIQFNFVGLLLILLIKDEISCEVVPEYLGCYDNKEEIRLTEYEALSKDLIRSDCTALCFTKGFTHASIKNGKMCFCGDLKESDPTPDDENLCDMPCSGNTTEICGGKSAYSLFSTGIIEEEIDIEELEIGCLEETGDTRIIKEHKNDLKKTNSPKRCIAYCKALGFPHAGLQYSSECYCGLARRTYPLVSGCNMRCTGNSKFRCGGRWRSMIYFTGITKPPTGIISKGCYEYKKVKREITSSDEQMNPKKCISTCYLKNYRYAHIFNGTECFCGQILPSHRYRGEQEFCDIQCNDGSENCGGETHVSTYTTGTAGHPMLGKLNGCYNDQKNNLLQGLKLNLGSKNSVSDCIVACILQGYAFAGLKNVYECQCSQNSPKRVPVTIAPDTECSSPCPKHQLQTCGSPNFVSIYRTGLTAPADDECTLTFTISNGARSCGGKTLFYDDFDTFDKKKWKHSVKISGEDSEFVTYTSKKKNVYTENGKLVIRPTLVNEKFVKYGTLNLTGCTGKEKSSECLGRAKSFAILPPVESGQVCTKNSFSFLYGNITIRAKMPKGDWVVPQIWLKPAKQFYGPGYTSGKFLIARVRGNKELIDKDGTDIGAKTVESGFQVASENGTVITKTTSITSSDPCYTKYLNYYFSWTPDRVQFRVQGDIVSGFKTTYAFSGSSLLKEMGLDQKQYWSSGTVLAPFDQEFYLCIGLSVGGTNSFPDGSLSSDVLKPWNNGDIKGRLKFLLSENTWKSTWSEDTKLEIDYIKVVAF